MVVRIAPSILSADFADLAGAVDAVAGEADWLHVDVMDGHFVPNLTIGPPVVAALRRHSDIYLDCHLMMTNPADHLEAFKEAGADHCSVHVEVGDTDSLLAQMQDLGLDKGLAVNPETPFESYARYLERLDLLLLMTVHPGFGGQDLIAGVLPKIRRTSKEIAQRELDLAIEVDGGIDHATIAGAARAGASVFVAGTAVFGEHEPAEAVRRLRDAALDGASS